MKKSEALSLFKGVSGVARAVGITTQAVSQWPEDLSPRIEDRVIAAKARRDGIGIVAKCGPSQDLEDRGPERSSPVGHLMFVVEGDEDGEEDSIEIKRDEQPPWATER